MAASASLAAFVWILALPAPVLAQQASEPLRATAAADEAENREIIVTGSRLLGGFTAPTPVTVVGQARIEGVAATNLGDVMARLPAFRTLTAPTTALSSTGSGGNLGARYLDLRGLGANRTLVLVEGRRFVASSILNSVDSNLIPALLVKRVEIVTGGASAAYGSDAVAGVVNILLNKDMEGFRAQAQSGISQMGDAGSTQASLAYGTGFGGGRGRFVVAGEWSDDKASGNCYSRDWCAGEHSLYQNPAFRTNGQPANFWASGVRPSTMTQTGIVNSPTSMRGIVFNPDGSVRAQRFQYGATPDIQFMIGGEGQGQNFRFSVPYLKIPVQRYSLFSNLEYDFSEALTGFLTLSYGQSKAQNRGAAMFERALTIRTDNPFIPASLLPLIPTGTTSFVLGRAGGPTLETNDIGPTSASGKSDTLRLATGLEGKLGGSWAWDAYYQYGRSNYRVDVINVKNNANFNRAIDAVRGPNGPICRSTLTNANDGCVPLNLFGQGQFSQAAFDYSFGKPWQTQQITQHVAALNVRGEVAQLWAGPLAVAAGIEYRREVTKADADATGIALGWQYGNGPRYTGRVETKEGYFEASLPLAKDMSFAHLFEANGAVRLTDYSTSGTVTTWKAGLVYEPIEGLRFRGTRSRDIRAPSAQELFNRSVTPGQIVNRLNSIQGIARVLTGGNPDLKPEFATTWTAGVVITPGGEGILRPLRLSIDWYDISLQGAIAALGAQQIVDRCQLQNAADMCSLFTLGSDGAVSEVRASQLNLNQLIARGWDIEFDYRIELGPSAAIGLNLLGTYTQDLITVDSVGPIERAGQTGMQYLGAVGVPRWSLTSTTTLELGKVTATIENRYIPRGIYDTTLIGPEDAGYATTLPNSVSRNRVDARFYTNLGLNFRIGQGERTQFEVYGFVSNLFNQDPPLVPGTTATNPALFDTIGRAFQVGVRVKH
jgi:outer membrane receptor protein involved in Fe transport